MPICARLHARRRPRRFVKLRRLGLAGLTGLVALPLASNGPVRAVDSATGQVLTLGAAANLGVAPGRPVTGMARTATGRGYWLAASDGGVYAFGDAPFLGTAPGALRQPIVDIAATASGLGYWLAGQDGGIFAFGDAAYAGSLGDLRLNASLVGVAPTPSGKGYYLAAEDGGVFAFGDALFLGSAGGSPLNAPIVGISATPSGKGYRLLARDGGVFAFGDAQFAGSPVGSRGPFVDITTSADGNGYWVAASDGSVRSFGSATAPATALPTASNAPVTALEATPSGDGVWLATGGEAIGDFGVTCYALQGITASGAPVSRDVVAVDPRAVPLGSEIFLGGLGVKRALDTGGAIKGRRLDIWNPSIAFCREFGLRRLTAYVVH